MLLARHMQHNGGSRSPGRQGHRGYILIGKPPRPAQKGEFSGRIGQRNDQLTVITVGAPCPRIDRACFGCLQRAMVQICFQQHKNVARIVCGEVRTAVRSESDRKIPGKNIGLEILF